MKNQYFLKDKKAEVYEKTASYKDEYGVTHSGGVRPISASALWCYARQTSQNVRFHEGNFYASDETRLFVFNNNQKIKPEGLIKYKNAWFTITRVDTQDDYNGDMFVYVEDTPTGDIPKPSNILPYSTTTT